MNWKERTHNMNAKQIANRIDQRRVDQGIQSDVIAQAREHGYVILYVDETAGLQVCGAYSDQTRDVEADGTITLRVGAEELHVDPYDNQDELETAGYIEVAKNAWNSSPWIEVEAEWDEDDDVNRFTIYAQGVADSAQFELLDRDGERVHCYGLVIKAPPVAKSGRSGDEIVDRLRAELMLRQAKRFTEEEGETRVYGMTYEEGVRDAVLWFLNQGPNPFDAPAFAEPEPQGRIA